MGRESTTAVAKAVVPNVGFCYSPLSRVGSLEPYSTCPKAAEQNSNITALFLHSASMLYFPGTPLDLIWLFKLSVTIIKATK